ncbi:MAG TPA: diaminopimelate epimerase [Candidatus Sulfotelmatobacter sp.]|jgi:diaminopimelate epimerase|nr:diaminopimelate epimerase [Candidatus Sulfotelmatobacter sp.]
MTILSPQGRSFLKMHGLGNDFVVLDARTQPLALSDDCVRAIGDRRTGVGFDQMVILEPPRDPSADVFMALRNNDGSEVGACGNASRCVARLLMEETGKSSVTIQTLAGLLYAESAPGGLYSVDMGPARLDWRDIPLASEMDSLRLPVSVDGMDAPVGVGMGNPHAVFFVSNAETAAVERIGPRIETHPLFPEKTNVEFAQVLSPDRIRMRVWERGAGVTQACGTGACATLVAAARRGLTGRKADVVLDGGVLTIEWRDDNHVMMTGSASLAYAGRLDSALLP